ncbi:uncharacterized protein [Cicer arietinum]|uniref:uncharacterized protein n=1 Tax=Cicer arietinum TaxID=3827 RepID=UPI003CC5505C
MFVSYIGAVVRQNVPITIDNWRDKALKDAKDIIWNDIQTTFVLDEERKSYVLRVAGKIHRGFRSHLSNFYLKDREGNTNAEPPKIYQHYISKDEWSAFVSKRSDPAFVNISTANRERASNPKHPYKKSRMGYARLEQKIRKDTQADQPLGRHILWKEARVNKEGVVDNENVKKVVELCETIEQSSETQEGNKDTCRDILGKVFNVPEYSGRVRGKGFGVTPKSFFPQEKRQKPSNEEVLEKLRILSEQVALLVNTNKDKQLPVQLQPEIQMESETGSCNLLRWHHEDRLNDGLLRHSADSLAWKDFDARYPIFSSDPRNVRSGVAFDGFNPLKTMSILDASSAPNNLNSPSLDNNEMKMVKIKSYFVDEDEVLTTKWT